MAARTVILKSCDKQSFKVDFEVAEMFDYLPIQTRLEGPSGSKKALDKRNCEANWQVIPLKSVTGAILEKVLEWAKHEVEEKRNGKARIFYRFTGLTEWEENYLADGRKRMCDVIKAANFLGAMGLLDLHFKFVYNWLRGRSHVEVPDILMFQVGRILTATWPRHAQRQIIR